MSDHISNQIQGGVTNDLDDSILWDEWLHNVWAADDEEKQDRAMCPLQPQHPDDIIGPFRCDQPEVRPVEVARPLMDNVEDFDPSTVKVNASPSSQPSGINHGPAGSNEDISWEKPRLKCPHGCNHGATFSGKYELDRHVSTKHGAAKFECPVVTCYKKQTRTAFIRPDKLTAHIRAVHPRDRGLSLECPAKGCTIQFDTIELLAVHAAFHQSTNAHTGAHLRAIVLADISGYRECTLPLCHWTSGRPGCRDAFMRHLATHTLGELDGVAELLSTKNYVVSELTGLEHTVDLTPLEAACGWKPTAQTIRVLCPVCSLPFEDHDSLENHIDLDHLIEAKHSEHFEAWRQHCEPYLYARFTRALFPWQVWHIKRRDGCPFCGAESNNSTGTGYRPYEHHIGMLADPEAIKPFREEILRLYPDFVTHPVWNDFII